MTIYELLETDQDSLEAILKNKMQHYVSFPIKKSSGKLRWLDAPDPELKALQTKVLHRLVYNFTPHKSAVGFRVGMGVGTGAERHLGNKVLLCMDLKNFFNSITYDHVIRLMYFMFDRSKNHIKDWLYTQNDIENITELVTFHKSLPQGAPTSPALANLVCWKLDRELTKLCDKNTLQYTRYADDLAFSHEDKTHDIKKHIPEIEQIIKETTGLSLNEKKTRVMRPHRRMTVTGVVINDKLSLPKTFRRNLRARIHNLACAAEALPKEEVQVIRGHIEWIHSINPQEGQKFRKAFSEMLKATNTMSESPNLPF